METTQYDILIVDDEPANLRLLRIVLGERSYKVRSAVDGAMALKAVQAKRPDLILLDIDMPGLNGYQVCAHLKAGTRTHDIPVIFLSAAGETSDKVKAFGFGGADYITKPFQLEEVLARVQHHLALARLQQELRHLNQTLEQKVEERTQELQATNARLRGSEAYNRLILETALDAVITIDAAGRVTGWNPQAETIFGWAQDEMIGRTLAETIISPEYRDAHRHRVKHYEESGGKGPMLNRHELTALRRNGEVFPIELTITPLEKPNEAVSFSAFLRDITERKQAEAALRLGEERYRRVVEDQTEYVMRWLPDGAVLFANDSCCRYFGKRPGELRGANLFDLIPKTDHARLRQKVASLTAEHPIVREEHPVTRPDGSRGWHAWNDRAILDETGQIVEYQSVGRDITERKQAEADLRRLNAELEDRVRERTAELEAANKELEAFSYSVSHDLRAPLRAIEGFTRILLKESFHELTPKAQHYLERIHNNTRNMSDLIDHLLQFSRMSRRPLGIQSVDARSLVCQVLGELNAIRADRQVEIDVGKLPACQADRHLLKQVFHNLLSNALKYTQHEEAARIAVGTSTENGAPVYFVADNGVGFDMQNAHKLFGVFQRLHRAEDYEGTGVGLAIVQRIIHRHGGRIWAQAEPNRGATFFFTLTNGLHDEN